MTKLDSWTTYQEDLRGSVAYSRTMKLNMVECFRQSGELVGTFWRSLRKLQGERLTVWFHVNVLIVFRDDVTTLLTKAGSGLTVKALLDNLQETLEFETSMAKKWATPVSPFTFISHLQLLIDSSSKICSRRQIIHILSLESLSQLHLSPIWWFSWKHRTSWFQCFIIHLRVNLQTTLEL